MSTMVTVAKWTQRDFFSKAIGTQKAQLLTIPYSHYCELSRWSLICGKVEYDECAYSPFQHILPMLKARVGGQDLRGNGSKVRDAKKILETDKLEEEKEKPAFKGSATGVPMYIRPDGSALLDSIDIANEVSGLAPLTDTEMKKLYDEKLGPLARQMAYSFFLKKKNRDSWDKLVTNETFGSLWGYIWYWWGNAFTDKMSSIFQPGDNEVIDATHKALLEIFEIIAERRIRPKKGKYINGDALTVEDLVCASLAGAVLFPPLYCGGEFTHILDELFERDPASKAVAEEFRATDLGKYVLWLYENERPKGLVVNL